MERWCLFPTCFNTSSDIQADWSNLGPLLNYSALIGLGWGVGSGPSKSQVCYRKSVDILKENWGARTRMLNAGKAKTDMHWRVAALTTFISQIRSDQSLSRVQLFATPWIAANQASLSITNSRSSLRLMSIKSVMPSSHLILCRPLLLLPPMNPSQHQSLFPMSQLFTWGGQSTGVSALA